MQEQATLHQMKLLLGNFHYMLEPLEEYIERKGYYPNFRSKRQLYGKVLPDSDLPVENDEDLFLSQVFIFASAVRRQPDFFRGVIQEEFYKWIDYTGIVADNCPEVLKHFLIEINNVINGNDEKIIRETREKTRNYEINPKDIVGLFSGLQQPLNRNREQKVALEGKIWNELPNEDKFNGNPNLGKLAFEQIERSVSIPHQNFRLRYFGKKRPTEQEQIQIDYMNIDQGEGSSLRFEVPLSEQGVSQNKLSDSFGKSSIVIVMGGIVLVVGLVVYRNKKRWKQ